MSLEELEQKATDLRTEKDKITEELKEIVKQIDSLRAEQSVKNIISGLSEDQKIAMYSQLIGVNSAVSSAKGKNNG